MCFRTSYNFYLFKFVGEILIPIGFNRNVYFRLRFVVCLSIHCTRTSHRGWYISIEASDNEFKREQRECDCVAENLHYYSNLYYIYGVCVRCTMYEVELESYTTKYAPVKWFQTRHSIAIDVMHCFLFCLLKMVSTLAALLLQVKWILVAFIRISAIMLSSAIRMPVIDFTFFPLLSGRTYVSLAWNSLLNSKLYTGTRSFSVSLSLSLSLLVAELSVCECSAPDTRSLSNTRYRRQNKTFSI